VQGKAMNSRVAPHKLRSGLLANPKQLALRSTQ
jgi:hypothetical protein